MKTTKYISYFKSILKKIKKSLQKKSVEIEPEYYCYDALIKNDLIIFDDFLPNLSGSWRATEIGRYLKEVKKVTLVCLLTFYSENNKDIQFSNDKNLFIEKFGLELKEVQIVKRDKGHLININSKLAYCLFYHIIKYIFPYLQKYQIPFVFTLFPGGDFAFYDHECDLTLSRIAGSPLLKGVIVTQQCTYDYLIDRKIFRKDQLHIIYGACFPIQHYILKKEKTYYGRDKAILDICFVATKYIKGGIDKGFDVFCHTAHKLSQKYNFIKFHIVGSFTQNDLMFDVPLDRINFYGVKPFDWFTEFYVDKDIIISPAKPDILKIGAFDGFPTAGVVDAGLLEVLMMTSDPLGNNCLPGFENWKEIVITENNNYSLVRDIERLIENPALIATIAKAGKEKCLSLFSENRQLQPRIELLKHFENEFS